MDAAAVPLTRNAWRAGLAAAFAGFLLVSTEAAHAQVPTINIQETCRIAASVMTNLSLGGTGANEVEICLDSEKKAREQLIKDWSSFRPADREGCIQTRVYLPSYIEWLTCFEMNKIVRQLKQQGQVAQGLSILNPDGSFTLPTLPGRDTIRRNY